MSDLVIFSRVNHIYGKVHADPSVLREIYDHFSFYADNYKFNPKYKGKIWDGQIHLLNYINQYLYSGLKDELKSFCQSRGYEFQTDFPDALALPDGYMESFAEWLNMPFPMRDYQLEAIKFSIENRSCLNVSATGSGKSAMIYGLSRWFLHRGKKVLIIVPSISLIHQMVSDFASYSTVNGWDAKSNCYKIFSGVEKMETIHQPIVVSTHQSIHAIPEKHRKQWLAQFDAVIVDEVHLFVAKTTKDIMENVSCQYRIGFTGTLKDTKTHRLTLMGLFGHYKQHTKTADLIEEGKLSDLSIKCITLKHTKRPEKPLKTYVEEIDYLTSNRTRNRFLGKLAASCEGNTLVLFSLVEDHAKGFYDLLKMNEEKIGKQIFYIAGEIDAMEREVIRQKVETIDNAIIVGSYGVMSTGWNQPSLRNLIFAISGKSKIRNLQTIGRGLRLSAGKEKCQVYDVADDLTFGRKKLNHSMNHLMERYNLYMEERFKVDMMVVELPSS